PERGAGVAGLHGLAYCLTCLQRWLVHQVGSASSSSGTSISTGSRCGYGREIGPRCGGPQIAPSCGTAAGTRGSLGQLGGRPVVMKVSESSDDGLTVDHRQTLPP